MILTKITNVLFLIGYATVALVSLYVLFLVLRKPSTRKEWFLVSTTFFLFLTGAINCGGLTMTFLDKDSGTWFILLASILNFVYIEAHWLFQLLLLKTAMILPIVLENPEKSEMDPESFERE